jgi:hypothetical protein
MRRGMREDEAYVKTEEEFLGRIRALQRWVLSVLKILCWWL